MDGASFPETPQAAAERIWAETDHDPVETMRRFDEWAQQTPERMLAVLGVYWGRAVRGFLERPEKGGGWPGGNAFHHKFMRHMRSTDQAKYSRRRERMDSDPEVRTKAHDSHRLWKERRSRGVKVVRAEVDVTSGAVVGLIDKEYGPFAHIRLGGMRLHDLTPQQALAHCDKRDEDNAFVRALCRQMPNQGKLIGEQWTVEMIRKAKQIIQKQRAA